MSEDAPARALDAAVNAAQLRVLYELGRIYLLQTPTDVVDVAPLYNRLVLFWSDARVPHEVLPSRVDRYALSIWYEDPKPPGPVDDGSPYFLGE